MRLSEIMKQNGHSNIDLLKLDIEGAEYKVLESIVEDELNVTILCVEYDVVHTPLDSRYKRRIIESIKSLVDYGYDLIAVDGCNYTFVKNPGAVVV